MIDLTGQRFGMLTVVRRDGLVRQEIGWVARCDCGDEVRTGGHKLRSGHTTSCGCKRSRGVRASRHGLHPRGKKPAEYGCWIEMRARCLDPANRAWPNYGGRGVKVCARWLRSFADFLADMGPRPSREHSIDRKDNAGNYEPGNCRWATRTEQNRNTRVNVMLTLDGETMCQAAWAERLGIKSNTLIGRLKSWDLRRALTTKATVKFRRKPLTGELVPPAGAS